MRKNYFTICAHSIRPYIYIYRSSAKTFINKLNLHLTKFCFFFHPRGSRVCETHTHVVEFNIKSILCNAATYKKTIENIQLINKS